MRGALETRWLVKGTTTLSARRSGESMGSQPLSGAENAGGDADPLGTSGDLVDEDLTDLPDPDPVAAVGAAADEPVKRPPCRGHLGVFLVRSSYWTRGCRGLSGAGSTSEGADSEIGEGGRGPGKAGIPPALVRRVVRLVHCGGRWPVSP